MARTAACPRPRTRARRKGTLLQKSWEKGPSSEPPRTCGLGALARTVTGVPRCEHAQVRDHGRTGQRQRHSERPAGPRLRSHSDQRRRHLPLARAEPHEDRRAGAPRSWQPGNWSATTSSSRSCGSGSTSTTGTTASSSTASRATDGRLNSSWRVTTSTASIHLDLPDEEVRRRVLARRLCSRCGLDYNLIAHRPEVADRCDVCGGELVSREDDTEEALAARLRDYHGKTEPRAGHLSPQGVRLHRRRPARADRGTAGHPRTAWPAAPPAMTGPTACTAGDGHRDTSGR